MKKNYQYLLDTIEKIDNIDDVIVNKLLYKDLDEYKKEILFNTIRLSLKCLYKKELNITDGYDFIDKII